MFWISISHKIHDMMSLKASKNTLKDHDKIKSLHYEVHALLNELPLALRPQFPDQSWDEMKPQLPAVRHRIVTTVNIFLLALHRPYVATHILSKHAATEAAFDLLQAQQRLFHLVTEPQHKLYGHSFYTLDAAMFLAAMAMGQPPEDFGLARRVQQELQLAVTRLSLMKERNPVAKTGELILRHCYQIIGSNLQTSLDLNRQTVFPEWLPATELSLEHSNSLLQDFSFRTPYEPAQHLVSTMLSDSTYACTTQQSDTFSALVSFEDPYNSYSSFSAESDLPLIYGTTVDNSYQ